MFKTTSISSSVSSRRLALQIKSERNACNACESFLSHEEFIVHLPAAGLEDRVRLGSPRVEVVPLAEFPRAVPSGAHEEVFRWSSYKEEK